MAKQSNDEIAFRAKYPNARVFDGKACYTIFVGDYICAEGETVALAFREAMSYDEDGLITPDPNEVAHTAVGVGQCKVCEHYGADCTGVVRDQSNATPTHGTVATDEELAEERNALSPEDRENVDALAEQLLEAAAAAQEAYWDALSELEDELGFDVDAVELGELSGWTVERLREKCGGSVCNGDGCEECVNENAPYHGTPCGTFCAECMKEHVQACGICAAEFGDDFDYENDEEPEEDIADNLRRAEKGGARDPRNDH